MRIKYWLLIAAALFLASCQECPTCPQSAVVDVDKARLIQPGKYRVCDDGGPGGHGDSVGKHLQVDAGRNVVEIGKIDAVTATRICLSKECPPLGETLPAAEGKELWMSGNDQVLSTVSLFDHLATGNVTVQVPHLVRIERNPDERGDCTLDNVITISFCALTDAGDEWTCVGTGPHLGHAHAEN